MISSNETTYKTYEVRTILPPSAAPEQRLFEQLQSENAILKQELDKQIQSTKLLEITARDFSLLSRKLDELTLKYSEVVASKRSLELDNETLQKRMELGDEELRRLKRIVAERTPVEEVQEKLHFQEKRVDELLKELEVWKAKFATVSSGKDQELEGLKAQIAANSQANLEKNLALVRAKYEAEMEKLNLEIKRLNDMLQGRQAVIEGLKGQEEQIRVLKAALHDQDAELKDLQGKMTILMQERDVIMASNHAMGEEMGLMKERMGRLVILEKAEEQLQVKIKENEVLKGNLLDLENRLQEFHNFEGTLREYEVKFGAMETELDQLKQTLLVKNKEYEELVEKYDKLDSKLTEALTLEVRVKEAVTALELKHQENEELKADIMKLKDQIAELERRIEVMTEDFQQIEALKRTNEDLEAEIARLADLVGEKVQELEVLREENLKYETLLREKSLNEAQKRDYEERITLLIRELDELNGKCEILETSIYSVTEYEAKIREFEDRVMELSQEIERLTLVIREKDVIIEEWEVKVGDLEGLHRERLHWEEAVRDSDVRFEALKKELEALRQHDTGLEVQNQLFTEKIHEYDEDFVKMGVERETLVRVNQEHVETIARLEALLNELRVVIEERETKLREFEQANQELQDDLRGRHEEKVKMKGMADAANAKLGELIKELEGLKVRLAQLEEERARLIKENEVIRGENAGLKKNLGVFQVELDKKSREIDDFKAKLQKALADLDRLGEFLRSKEQELKEKNGIILLMDKDLAELTARCKAFETKVGVMGPELERLTVLLERKEKEIERLHGIIVRFEKENADGNGRFSLLEGKLGGLLVEMDRMTKILREKEEEIERRVSEIAGLKSQIEQWMGKYRELEQKLTLVVSEFERVKLLLVAKEKEILVLIEKNNGFENSITLLTRELQFREQETGQKSQGSLALERENKELLAKFAALESKISLLTSELERQKDLLSRKEGEIERSKREWALRDQEVERWKREWTVRDQDFGEKLQGFERENKDLLAKIMPLESKVSLMSSEIERQRDLLGRKDGEIERLKLEIAGRDRDFGGRSQVYEREDNELSSKILVLEDKITAFIGEVERLKGIILLKDQEIERISRIIIVKEQEFTASGERRVESEDWKRKYELAQKEVSDIQSKVMNLENKIVMISSEFERLRSLKFASGGEVEGLRGELRLRIEELEMMKRLKAQNEAELADLKSRFTMIGNETNGLLEEIERFRQEVALWKGRYEGAENEYKQRLFAYENKISLMSGEMERLKRLVQKKDNEIGESMRKSGDWGLKMRSVEEALEVTKRRNLELLMQIVILYSEIDRLRLVAQI